MFENFRRSLRVLRILRRFSDDTLNSIQRFEEGIKTLDDELDAVRSRFDVSDELFERFQTDRVSEEYRRAYDKTSPLVSICICTYNRERLLVERSIRSIRDQDYQNWELVIVGDGCTDNTEALVAKIGDKRIHFVNLMERGRYPEYPAFRWMVAGSLALNHAFSLVKGDFITQLDDDDEYTPGRLTKLVNFIRETRADFVWHPFWAENRDGTWRLNNAQDFKRTLVTTSSILYHSWFKVIQADINAYKFLEPGDWNRLRKIKYLGAKAVRYHEPLLKHYRERNQ